MARYVLLAFDDNAEADSFVAAVGEKTVFCRKLQDSFYDHLTGAAVRAVWAKPTQFCDCGEFNGVSVGGAKFGWWLHRACGKPRRGSWQHPRNLLDPPEMSARERTVYLGIVEGSTNERKATSPSESAGGSRSNPHSGGSSSSSPR